jgi:hypothetical protein
MSKWSHGGFGLSDNTQFKEKTREEKFNKFLHDLDNNHLNTAGTFEILSDAEIEMKIREYMPKIRKNNVLATVFLVFGFISMIILGTLFGEFAGFTMFLFFAAGVGFSINANIYKNKLKIIVSNNIIRSILENRMELTIYSPGNHIGADNIRFSGLVQQKWNRISGSDLVEGAYKGVNFSFSDIHLKHETGSGKNRKVQTRFKGQWLIVELKKEIPWSVELRHKSGKVKSDIETENIEFNKTFQILTRDPHTAFYILTPHFMEYIKNAKRRSDSQMFMKFDRRHVHIALHSGRDLFEPFGKKLFAMENIANLRMQMTWDVNYITGIIDELLYNENLFGRGG